MHRILFVHQIRQVRNNGVDFRLSLGQGKQGSVRNSGEFEIHVYNRVSNSI